MVWKTTVPSVVVLYRHLPGVGEEATESCSRKSLSCLQATFKPGISGLRIKADKRSDTTCGLVTWNSIISKLAVSFLCGHQC
jgi:hypothetical protein